MPLKARKLRKAAKKARQVFQILKSEAEHAFAEEWKPERLGKKIVAYAAAMGNMKINGLSVMQKVIETAYVEDIIKQGADIETRDKRGWTALMHAAANGYTDLCNLLLEHKANMEARTWKGYTPLMLAVVHDRDGTAKALMERGARIDATNDNGDNAYDIAKKRCPSLAVLVYSFSMDMAEKMFRDNISFRERMDYGYAGIIPKNIKEFHSNFIACMHSL